MRTRNDIALFAAVLLSGAASLMYQIAWTRRLITVTSATATAQAVVLGVFMAGLGIGALAGARLAARIPRPLVGYAAVEAAAGLLAVASLPVISASEGLRPVVGIWGQLVLVALCLLAATTLLGASLPLLLEHGLFFDESAGRRGRLVGALYGLNTFGAAVGCVLAGFVTVENLGLSGTIHAGVAMALAAALVAVLGGGSRRRSAPAESAIPDSGPVEPMFMAGAFLAGFVGLGAEVLWTRLFGLIIPNTVYAVTQVLFAVLAGIALGSLSTNVAARVLSRAEDPRAATLRLGGLVASLVAVLLAAIPFVVIDLADESIRQKAVASGRSFAASFDLLVYLVPISGLIAAILPLLVMASRTPRGSQAFGHLYAVNTGGSVLGSMVAGFFLIPVFGTALTGGMLQAAALVLAASLLAREAKARWIVALAAVACLVMYFSHDLPRQIYAKRVGDQEEILEFREGISSNAMVTQDHRTGARRLWINSIWVAGTGGPHAAFGHVPALFVAEPKRALGIALGTGQTFAAVLAHDVAHLDCVEIDENVIELSRRWFAGANGGLLDHPRVEVHNDDGRAFLRTTEHKYDVIVLEPLQAWTAGTTNLYTKEFYEEARRVLAEGGVIAQWIPFYGQGPDETRAMVRTGLEVFEHAALWLTLRDGVVIYSTEPFQISLSALARRIEARGLAPALSAFPADSAADLTSFLLLGPRGIAAWTEGAEVIRDDRPFLEFRAAGDIGAGQKYGPTLATVLPHLDPLEDYLVETSTAALEEIRLAGRVRRNLLQLRTMVDRSPEERVRHLESLLPDGAGSAYWRSRYRNEVLRQARAEPARAREILDRALERVPGLPAVARARAALGPAPATP